MRDPHDIDGNYQTFHGDNFTECIYFLMSGAVTNLSKADQAKAIHAVCRSVGFNLAATKKLIDADVREKTFYPGGLAKKTGQYSPQGEWQRFYDDNASDDAHKFSSFIENIDHILSSR